MTLAPGTAIGRTPPRKKVLLHGTQVELYGIGWFAMITGRTSQCVRVWERKGLIPPPLVTLKGCADRWYLGVEIGSYASIFQQERPNRQQGFKATQFKELCWKANSAMKKSLQQQMPTMFAPLIQAETMEQIVLKAQAQRRFKHKAKTLSKFQRQAKRLALQSLNRQQYGTQETQPSGQSK